MSEANKLLMFETSSLIDIAKGILRGSTEIEELVDALKKLVHLGKIKVVYTHVQVDEMKSETQMEVIRDLLSELGAELVSTRVAVVGTSKVGMSAVTGELESQLYNKLRTPESKMNWLKDLIQALTAIEMNVLVTNDDGVHHAMKEIRGKLGGTMRCEVYYLREFSKMVKCSLII